MEVRKPRTSEELYCSGNNTGKNKFIIIISILVFLIKIIQQVDTGDRATLAKLVESIKNNFNERFDEFKRHWGGGILGAKSACRLAKIEKAKEKELAQKQ